MSNFEDLSPYSYRDWGESGLINIGWIGAGMQFARGDVVDAFRERLRLWIRSTARRYECMGPHKCDLCQKNLASGEIRVPAKDGRVYAAPSGILHHIESHGYKPPDDFIEAVMTTERIEPPWRILVEASKSKFINNRARVMDDFAALENEESFELLLAGLSDPEGIVRWKAGLALSKRRDVRAIPALLDVIRRRVCDGSDRDVLAAFTALSKLGPLPPEAEPVVQSVLQFKIDAEIKELASSILAENHWQKRDIQKSWDYLRWAATCNMWSLRWAAVIELGKRREPEAIALVQGMVNDEHGTVRRYAQEALNRHVRERGA